MSQAHLEELDRTLLYISEARERAERVARSIRQEEGDVRLAQALEEADRGLLAVHGTLLRSVYFPEAGEKQLKLAG